MHESMYGENGSFINTWHHTKVSSFCRLYGSVDLMAIDGLPFLTETYRGIRNLYLCYDYIERIDKSTNRT